MITFGFSKEHRPDLKQLVHSLLCVDDGIPIYSKCESGNLSDKVVNRNLIPRMVERMAELGQDDFLYAADSALIIRENLPATTDTKRWRISMEYYRALVVHSEAYDERRAERLGGPSRSPYPVHRRLRLR